MLRPMFVVVALLSCTGGGMAQESDDDPVRRFESRVAAYVALHRSVEGLLPAPQLFTDYGEAQKVFAAMSEAMRTARPAAHEGEIFGDDVAPELRRRINDGLRAGRLDPADLLAEMQDTTEPDARPAVVNEKFSWAVGNLMPPSLLMRLPTVPDELQFRLVGRDLVLIDIHAGLVVDLLRNVLPNGHHP